MRGAPIAELNSGLQQLKSNLIGDPLACLRVELALVSFNDQIAVEADFCSPENFNPPALNASGGTHLGAAVLKGLEMLKMRTVEYRAAGNNYYRPWLLVVTDAQSGDAPFVLELDDRPAFFRQHRPWQPAHVQSKVVNAAQINICANGAVLQHFQKMFGLGFQHNPIPDRIQCFVLDGPEPTDFGFLLFELWNFVHDVLPRPLGGGGIASFPINARQLQAEGGRDFGFIFGSHQAKGFVLVASLEGGLLFGNEVFAVVGAPAPAEHAVTVIHCLIHGYEHEPSRTVLVSAFWAS